MLDILVRSDTLQGYLRSRLINTRRMALNPRTVNPRLKSS